MTSQVSWEEALLEESLSSAVKSPHPVYKKPNQTKQTRRLPKNRETKEELKCRSRYKFIYTSSSAEMPSNASGTFWNCFSSSRFGSEKSYTDCTIRWSDFCSPHYKINQLSALLLKAEPPPLPEILCSLLLPTTFPEKFTAMGKNQTPNSSTIIRLIPLCAREKGSLPHS